MNFLAASGIADQFGLELPKLIAQVIIFGVVFWVLKAKAFGPIMAMLEQRRQRIADGESKLEKIAKRPRRCGSQRPSGARQSQRRSRSWWLMPTKAPNPG
jgi:hypothetical protein